jgi:hypothetical protein
VLAPGEALVDVEPLGEHARALADGPGLLVGVVTQHRRGPLGGPDEIEQHVDGRRLPRAVGAEEAEDLPLPDFHVDPAQGLDVAEALGDPVEFDGCHCPWCYPPHL